MSKFVQKIIFAASILIHLEYYISAYFTHNLDIFFEHVTMGQDFFQIPNAAYSFLHGGTLTGNLPYGMTPYVNCCGVNSNVYHPFFTLLVGIPLQLFSPWTAFGLWGTLHFILTFLTVIFLWKKFSNHKYLYLALSLYLFNSYHYYEIKHAQYHFLLNIFLILFLYYLINNKNKLLSGFLYFLTLVVKPIGLLWFIPLVIKRYFKVAFLGIILYIFISVPFAFSPMGKYFFSNLFNVITTPIPSYNLLAITNLFPLSPSYIKYLGICIALTLVLLQLIKKIDIFTAIFLWVSYYLIFYSLVFHYHYTIFAGLICLGILLNRFSIKKIEIIPIIFLTIPSPIIFFHLFGDPAILPTKHLSIIALWSIFWLLALDLILIYTLFNHQSQKIHNMNKLPFKQIK